ncbi:MAG: MBOAT family protein [Magnetococcales bacterium]|nr:MBOAT family protein [Magnetococcales bacterium]
MIFHSLDFIVFLVLVLTIYWSLSHRMQNRFLLGASYLFYGYVHPWFLSLILVSTVTDYLCGLGMERRPEHKKRFLWISLGVNLGLLAAFKYFGFFVENVAALLNVLGLPSFTWTLHILLPVGISFYTFQTLSYSIDVYWGRIKPRRDFLDFALYVAFFPQLVAGPIERASRLLPQLEKPRIFNTGVALEAFHLLLWGFFKKLVIADNVAVIVNKIFFLENPTFPILWVGVFAFAIQIFADFSAYTDIARGTAKLMGVHLVQNFNHPFIAVSPSDFWARWHMSLTGWIREYVFTPMTLSLMRNPRTRRFGAGLSVFITFILVGFWHGASWNFILFGAYYGILFILFDIFGKKVPDSIANAGWIRPFRMLFMFLLVLVGFLIFRETDMGYLWHYLTLDPFVSTPLDRDVALFLFARTVLYASPIFIHIWFAHRWQSGLFTNMRVRVSLTTVAASLMFFSILTVRSWVTNDFIYFQF